MVFIFVGCLQTAPGFSVTSSDKYAYCEPLRYDSGGYIDPGREYGDGFVKLQLK